MISGEPDLVHGPAVENHCAMVFISALGVPDIIFLFSPVPKSKKGWKPLAYILFSHNAFTDPHNNCNRKNNYSEVKLLCFL